jgi:uncharacterized protein
VAALNALMPAPLLIPPLAARRFLRRALGLDVPFPTIDSALRHLGYVQIDPINVCGRMHDLILRNRVAGYREGDLMRHLHGGATEAPPPVNGSPGVLTLRGGVPAELPERARPRAPPLPAETRTAFEHHLPATHLLASLPSEAWPHLLGAMRQRTRRTSAWSGRLTPTERSVAESLLAEIAARGPLASEDFDDDRRARRVVWGAATLVKSTLQKLFFHGRVLIAQRVNNRRRYDLPERVLPARVLAAPEPTKHETARWLVLLKLRQRRLATLRRDEVPLVEDAVQPVTIAPCSGGRCPPLFCLREDVPLLETVLSETASLRDDGAAPAATPQLLAPLDPLIYDRRVTGALWGFDYTWEVYTPPGKRVRGYYALPVLAGTELVGHVEPKADRERGALLVQSQRTRRGHRVAGAVRELAAWLGLRSGQRKPRVPSDVRGSAPG